MHYPYKTFVGYVELVYCAVSETDYANGFELSQSYAHTFGAISITITRYHGEPRNVQTVA